MKFPYRWYATEPAWTAGDSAEQFRPEIPLRIIGPKGTEHVLGLLDTGADDTFIPQSIGERIGVVLDGNATWSVTGVAAQEVAAVGDHVTFEVSDGNETYRWQARVGVLQRIAPQAEPTVILGRVGFLEFFDAEFRGEACDVLLMPNDNLGRAV